MILKQITFCLFVILLLSSCFSMKPVEFEKTENMVITKADKDFEMNFDLAMHNPNNWSLRLADLETEVMIDDKPLAKAHQLLVVRLKRNSDFKLPINAKASVNDLMNLSSIGINMLLGKQTSTATIKGNMTLKKFIFRKKFHFEYKEKIDSKVLQSLF